MAADFSRILHFARTSLGPAFQGLRAIPLHAEVLGFGPSRAQKVAFLPAYGRNGAALLRIHRMAEALEAHGWRSLVLPPGLSLAQRRRFLQRGAPDVVVMQGARHALNRPWLYRDWPIVFDMDDADFHLPHLAGAVARAMPEVAAVIAGSRYIADWCRCAGAARAHVVWTGSPVSARARTAPEVRPPVVAWAQTRPMTYKAEAGFVAEVMRGVAARHPGVTLRLYDRQAGDDPGFADRFAAPGLTVEWLPAMPYGAYLDSFDDVALGLAPLLGQDPFVKGKSFGKVLAYLDRKVPVLASEAGEHGRFFTSATGVLSNDRGAWEAALVRLLQDGAARRTMAEAAFADFRARLSLEAAAEATDRVLRDVLSATSGSSAALSAVH